MTEEKNKEENIEIKNCEHKRHSKKECQNHKEQEEHKCTCNPCECNPCECTDECTCEDNCKCHDSSSEEISRLKEEIKKLQELNIELDNKVKYTQAEMINFRRRKEEEMLNKTKYANQDLIMEIIPVVDSFERAIKYDDNDLTDELSKFLDGFKMMYSQLTNILRNFGVEEIFRVGEQFDPKLEEALLTDSLEDYQEDEVLEVLLKGYKLKDRVIRPATVKVNKIRKEEK